MNCFYFARLNTWRYYPRPLYNTLQYTVFNHFQNYFRYIMASSVDFYILCNYQVFPTPPCMLFCLSKNPIFREVLERVQVFQTSHQKAWIAFEKRPLHYISHVILAACVLHWILFCVWFIDALFLGDKSGRWVIFIYFKKLITLLFL